MVATLVAICAEALVRAEPVSGQPRVRICPIQLT